MPAMTLAYTLHKNNIDNVNIDTSIDFAAMSGAFIGGTGDFVTLFEPTALNLEKEGYGYVVASVGQLGGEVPYTAFNAKKSYIEANPDIIEKFTKAIQKGLDYVYSNSSEESARVIASYFPDASINDIKTVIDRYMENDSWYKTTYISKEGFENIKEIIDYNGLLTKDVDYNILIDNTFNE